MSSLQEKLHISIFSAFLFALVSLPYTYKLTNSVVNTYSNDCPTGNGLLLHTFVFFILTFLSMWRSNHSTELKLKFSIYGALIFFFIASPAMFGLTGSIFGDSIAQEGCPTVYGVLLHALVFCIALTGVMYLPDISN
jgi:hypothetical protein